MFEVMTPLAIEGPDDGSLLPRSHCEERRPSGGRVDRTDLGARGNLVIAVRLKSWLVDSVGPSPQLDGEGG